MRPDQTRGIHVVRNTHWDRGFRDSFEKTRAKLIECLDTILDRLASDPSHTSFPLDGHAILAEGHLETRPERREEFAQRLRERHPFPI